ncbi:hypothetical protein SBV1_200010 [Verrucomicrobia bacterium]|nr:hypothetical protein SBV1_200010 [Verrucomicrobiota bacterium]
MFSTDRLKFADDVAEFTAPSTMAELGRRTQEKTVLSQGPVGVPNFDLSAEAPITATVFTLNIRPPRRARCAMHANPNSQSCQSTFVLDKVHPCLTISSR